MIRQDPLLESYGVLGFGQKRRHFRAFIAAQEVLSAASTNSTKLASLMI